MSAAMLAWPDARNWRQVIVPLFSSLLWTLGMETTKITTRKMQQYNLTVFSLPENARFPELGVILLSRMHVFDFIH
jgi:hypothetical protein